MASLTLERLSKVFSNRKRVVKAVDEVSLDVPDGELFVLLGESGCGKTTILRCVAGLETSTGGTIRFGESVVEDTAMGVNLPPEQRDLGMVFQSYALWPHMTVRKNLAFPLRARRSTVGLSEGWVDDIADLVHCGHLLDRYPGQLSGGQQQRIALARAMVARPSLVLFDEPLSNLDALLRRELRGELRRLHQQLGFTGVYVTHDQVEALTIGDRIGVMAGGHIIQVGRPREVYESPATEYVARFFGMSNAVPLGGIDLGRLDIGPSQRPSERGDDRAVARFRPEHTRVVASGAEPTAHHVKVGAGTLVDVSFAGHLLECTVALSDSMIAARVPVDGLDGPLPVGSVVDVTVDRRHAVVYQGDALDDDLAAAVMLTGGDRHAEPQLAGDVHLPPGSS